MDHARADLLRRLAAGPDRIAVAARAAEAARAAAGDAGARDDTHADAWSPRQNVVHLALVERLVFQARLDQLAEDGVPTWSWAELGTSDAPEVATLDRALAAFAAARAETIAHVAALDEAGWRRYGHHATFGRLDVAGLLGVIVDHDDQHRADMAALAGGAR
jgi:hypothetical protein